MTYLNFRDQLCICHLHLRSDNTCFEMQTLIRSILLLKLNCLHLKTFPMLTNDEHIACSVLESEQIENDEKTIKGINQTEDEIRAICLVGSVAHDDKLKEVLKTVFNLLVYESEKGVEYISQKDVAFVLENFCGPDFNYLYHAGRRIFGPTIIFESSQSSAKLPIKSRPLYCNAMKEVTVCFAGLHDKKVLSNVVDLVHHMGGSVRKNFTMSVTHVVTNTTQSSKYRLAVGMGKAVMHVDWIFKMWERRSNAHVSALSPDWSCFKLKPFFALKLYFRGFLPNEENHMKELAIQNGAVVTDCNACTHFVVDPSVRYEDLTDSDRNLQCRFVTAEWFWLSIQLDICANEDMYTLMDKDQKCRKRSKSPAVFENKRHAKRLSEFHGSGDLNPFSSHCSSLDVSSDYSSMLGDQMFSSEDLDNLMKSPKKGMSKRQQIAVEMLQTEFKYVQVLHTIITIYKEPLESPDSTVGGHLLDSAEMKLIFGNLPPIYVIHQKLHKELANLIAHWSEDRCIGNVWLQHADELVKAYPPFVNFYERTKETLNKCDKSKPRFHAFLKARQNRPESNRESLQELIIRPVQRLPSVILLLSELLKNTDKANKDYQCIAKAIDALKRVLTHINEDKRKTEGQVKLFDIVNEIENCPPYLLSSQRQFITSISVTSLSHGFVKKGSQCVFYLFNDCLEVAKSRQKTNGREETRTLHATLKPYKHAELLFLSNIRRVIDVTCFEEASNIFCLTIRNNMGDTNYPFQLVDETANEARRMFLEKLCDQVLKTVGRVDFCLQSLQSADADGDSDLALTIQKAIKHLKYGGRRLSRAFSFNKTQTSLRRAVSQIAVNVGGHLRRMSRSNLRLPLQQIHEEAQQQQSSSSLFFTNHHIRHRFPVVNYLTASVSAVSSIKRWKHRMQKMDWLLVHIDFLIDYMSTLTVEKLYNDIRMFVFSCFLASIHLIDWCRRLYNVTFGELEPWQISAYTFCAFSVFLWLDKFFHCEEAFVVRLEKTLFRTARRLPWVKRKISVQLSKTRQSVQMELQKNDPDPEFIRHLPDRGFDQNDIIAKAERYQKAGTFDFSKGKVSGAVYNANVELLSLNAEIMKLFCWSNPLHPDIFPGIRKMEAEIVRMVCNMFNGGNNACGTVTSGGTESLILACLAYRNRAYGRGNKDPEIVVPISAHGAFDKAAQMLRLRIRHVPLEAGTFKVDLDKMKQMITKSTCMYGFSTKGTSVLMYRNKLYQRYQYFCQPNWPGGIYATATVAGSRNGANSASCWATMLHFGIHGYVQCTRKIIRTARYIERKLREVKGIYIFGHPRVSVVAFTSYVFDIYAFASQMGDRGWSLNLLQLPPAVHFCITMNQTQEGVAHSFIEDATAVAEALLEDPSKSNDISGAAALYGSSQTLPDRTLVNEIACAYLDACYATETKCDPDDLDGLI
ncbi:Protein ECT2 [Trichinella patagoniensis]|uniref:Protein ECT2 n=1 Tax=Trichinella patagoniensis TaxID=990121 RepID=A0A0V1A771_9BILA|nr:Protein ECT2 [Trichinella patagoniensis]